MQDKKFEKLTKEMEFLIELSREMKEKEAGCRSQVLKSGSSVVLVDRKYKISFCDDLSKSISRAVSGVEMEEGRSVFDFIVGRDAEYCRENFNRALQGEAVSIERKVDVPGGSEHWFSMFYNPVFSDSGNITGVWLAVIDITEQKQVEEDLRIMDNSFQFSNSAIAISDFNGRITHVNPAFLELWGYSDSGEVTGRLAADFWETKGKLEEILSSLLEKRKFSAECRAKHGNGSFFYVQIAASVVFEKDGKPSGLVASSIDITRQKEAEQALRESEARYRLLVENQNDLLVKLDKDWKLDFVNPGYLEMFGKTEEELIGRTFFPLIHEDDRNTVRESLKNLMEPPFKCRHEERAMTVDGWKWFSWSNRAVVDEGGNVQEVIAVGRDITVQKEAEEALKKSSEELAALNRKVTNHDNFLQALLDSIPVPGFYKDNLCRYLGCNKAFTRMMGLTSREIEGKTAREIWPAEFSTVYHQKDLELLENLSEQEYEFQVKDKDGMIREGICCKNVFRDDRGQVAGIVGAFIDITDLKKTERALKSSEEQFRQLYEKSPVGYQSLDINGDLIIVNRTWLDTLGYKKEEVLGRSFREFMTEDSRESFTAGFDRIREEGNVVDVEFQLRKKDGEIFDASFNGIAVSDAEGNFLKTHCVFVDITRNKEILRTLRKVAGQAKGLKGFIPMCAGCKKIQDSEQESKPWVSPDQYISDRLPEILFSHGMCPECIRKWYPDYENGSKA